MYSELNKRLISGENIFTDIFGQNKTKTQLSSAILSDRHIIIVGPPGIGKTTLAKNVSELLPELTVNDCGFNCLPEKPACPQCIKNADKQTKNVPGSERFIRVQGSPDLTAEDLIGDIDPIKAMQYGPLSVEAFSPGKIFRANNGILFFDEINRCPEKLQNALLQVLEERKVTIGSYELDFSADFILIATMNPSDINTERLSEVFTDRFDYVYMSYPDSLETEEKIVTQKGKNFGISFPSELLRHIVRFVRELRENPDLEKVPSVRATLGLYERSQANALINKHQKVTFEDFQSSLYSVMNHRISLKPSQKFLQTPEEFIQREFERFNDKHKLSDSG